MKVYQNVGKICLGYDQIPDQIKTSNILSANDVARIAGQLAFPSEELLTSTASEYKSLLQSGESEKVHAIAKDLIAKEEVEKAFALLMSE